MSFPANVQMSKNNEDADLNMQPMSLRAASRGIGGDSSFNYISLSHHQSDENDDMFDEAKSNTDQKLPDHQHHNHTKSKSDFFYVNKNGFVQSVKTSKKPTTTKAANRNSDMSSQMKTNQNANQLICTNLILEVYKNNKDAKVEEKRMSRSEKEEEAHRVVPGEMHPCRSSFSTLNESSTNSLIERDIHGNIIINTNLTLEEPHIDITYDHVRYVNIFSLLCCWCFPITGIASIIYSRLTKKFYNMRDMQQAKKYLNRAEWLLMLTFFFGLSLLALGFAFLESNIFKSVSHNRSSSSSVRLFH